ncbi:hypothetical protein SELMODRAFT_425408 [Selaginella moellendorffii]|uniref:Protein kinase domain-containing protein n=1 Tax=Selaginella moellendorffii TaxID=88036 RepID=D8ST06_SELML|nr:hypothetical protein SELMODRAFT_425408 [Selaginella moellendorffii]
MVVVSWEAVVDRLHIFSPTEKRQIKENVEAAGDVEQAEDAVAITGGHAEKLMDFFKWYVYPLDDPGVPKFLEDLDKRFIQYNGRRTAVKTQELQMVSRQQVQLAAQYKNWDLSNLLIWLPPMDNKSSLGRVNSTRVERKQLERSEEFDRMGLPDLPFSRLFAENKETFVRDLRAVGVLVQRVTNEMDDDLKEDSYARQVRFLLSYAKAIARARNVPIQITVVAGETRLSLSQYYRIPDGFFRIGARSNAVEQKTENSRSLLELEEARGQLVVAGNFLFLERSKYHGVEGRSEMYGFVGTGLRVQCVYQAHEYDRRPQTVDGPLLPLADGDYSPGNLFTINMDMPAVQWIGATLDRQILEEGGLRAVSRDPFSRHNLELKASSGYYVGEQFLEIPVQSRMDDKMTVAVIGTALHTETSLVFRVSWRGQDWWLKVGPDVQRRAEALQTLEQEWMWERWFQTERDMFFRAQLGETGSFPVMVEGQGLQNRPAMLVKDVGEPLERLLFSSSMTPPQVYEMSKQLYEVLQCCASKGVYHGDVSLQNICWRDGTYSLIDWGLAYGSAFLTFVEAVDSAWPSLHVKTAIPGIPNWELSSNWYFLGMRPQDGVSDLESLLFCCLKILNENSLPWTKASESGSEDEVLELRRKYLPVLVAKNSGHLFEPLLAHLKRAGHPLITDNTLNLSLHTKVDDLQCTSSSSASLLPKVPDSMQDKHGDNSREKVNFTMKLE